MGVVGSLLGLSLIAGAAFLLAAAVAWLRPVEWPVVRRDGIAASLATLGSLSLAVLVWVASHSPDAPSWPHELASMALLAAPLLASLALRSRGRRSLPRALLLSGTALWVVVLWLVLHMRGPRGGWSGGEAVAVTLLATVAIASAACSGWWSKRARE